ncbi:DUF2461 domain-containing protein [bacterium]|nr:DUF2461 domain-containing protein [bacterium]
MAAKPVIAGSIFDFLIDLERKNTRDWFQANKDRYEAEYRGPALAFVAEMQPLLDAVSPRFRAEPQKVGGSLFRIHRDTRFSNDKTPYKTHCGIQFRHERGKDVHCPGYYLHLDPTGCFLGAGIWHPEKDALQAIRTHLDRDAAGWKKAVGGRAFASRWRLAGDSLKRAPKGWPADHPLIDDLRRKDFIAVTDLEPEAVVDPSFHRTLGKLLQESGPLLRWLCDAVGVPF